MPRISSTEWGPPRQNSQKLEKNIQIGPQAAEIEVENWQRSTMDLALS